MASPSMVYRTNIFSDSSIEKNYWPDSQLIATYLINLTQGEYIKNPSLLINVIWLTLWMLAVVFPILFIEPPRGIGISFLSLVFFLVMGSFAFYFYSLNLDFSRGILGSLVSQYILIPV